MLLTHTLQQLKNTQSPIFLGFSGGVDSQFLFDQLIQNNIAFTAIHIHHGLQQQADQWLKHCEDQCSQHNVTFVSKKVSIQNEGKGIENSARNARIDCFKQCLNHTKQKGILLLAHHQDDQIETFFLRLMRGASLNGLSAMSAQSHFYGHTVFRPLLELNKQDIIERSQHLNWVEDPSNGESKYDRNFLRNKLLPLLSTRWAQYRHNIQQSIQHIQNASADNNTQLQTLLDQYSNQTQLLIPLNLDNIDSLIYQWLLVKTQIKPTKNLIEELIKLVHAKNIQRANVSHLDVRFIFDGHALRIESPSDEKANAIQCVKPDCTYRWYKFNIRLSRTAQLQNNGLKPELDFTRISIDHRPNNEKLAILGRDKRRDLKRLIQEIDITWQDKQSLPFIFYDQKLIAIGQYFIVREFAAPKGDAGIEIICK